MKVLDAKIYKNERYINPPHLQILVDRIPKQEEMVFKTKKMGENTLYFAEKEGYVRFNTEVPSNREGYGGAIFKYTLEDGTIAEVKGPWSSNASFMAEHFIPSMDVSITDDPKAFERGYTFFAGHITIELAQTIKLPKGWEISNTHKYGWGPVRD